MQPNFSLRNAIVAAIVLSPAFITGLSLPWNFHNALAARSSVLSGGIGQAFAHEVRAKAAKTGDSQSGEQVDSQNGEQNESETGSKEGSENGSDGKKGDPPTVTARAMPTGLGGGHSKVPQPTGAHGGHGDSCGSAAPPKGTGGAWPKDHKLPKVGGRANTGKTGPKSGMPTSLPTGCGEYGSKPTGHPRPTSRPHSTGKPRPTGSRS